MPDLVKVLCAVLIVPAVVAIAHCNKAGCNTIVHAPQKYFGVSDAKEPYLDLGNMDTRVVSCEKFACLVTVAVKPWLHNPTAQDHYAVISCKYWIDDLQLDARKLKPVLVPAKKSVRVEVHHGLNMLAQRSRIGIDCDAEFRGINFNKEKLSVINNNFSVARVALPIHSNIEFMPSDTAEDSTETSESTGDATF